MRALVLPLVAATLLMSQTPLGAQEATPNACPATTEAENIEIARVWHEQAINNLTDEQFLELRKMNVLAAIYAHLVSLNNWRSLIGRRMQRLGVSEIEAVTGQRPS